MCEKPLGTVLFSIRPTVKPFCYWKWGFFLVGDWITGVSHPIVMNIFLRAGIRPRLLVHLFLLKRIQVAQDQLNVLSRSSGPLVDRPCKTCDAPCVFFREQKLPPNSHTPHEVHHPESFLLLMSRSCFLFKWLLWASPGWPGVTDWQMWRV